METKCAAAVREAKGFLGKPKATLARTKDGSEHSMNPEGEVEGTEGLVCLRECNEGIWDSSSTSEDAWFPVWMQGVTLS